MPGLRLIAAVLLVLFILPHAAVFAGESGGKGEEPSKEPAAPAKKGGESPTKPAATPEDKPAPKAEEPQEKPKEPAKAKVEEKKPVAPTAKRATPRDRRWRLGFAFTLDRYSGDPRARGTGAGTDLCWGFRPIRFLDLCWSVGYRNLPFSILESASEGLFDYEIETREVNGFEFKVSPRGWWRPIERLGVFLGFSGSYFPQLYGAGEGYSYGGPPFQITGFDESAFQGYGYGFGFLAGAEFDVTRILRLSLHFGFERWWFKGKRAAVLHYDIGGVDRSFGGVYRYEASPDRFTLQLSVDFLF
ncbi:MAG: hypothetical protein ACYS47_04645 [Planctomycetota bacterium]|jgi:hypothetical protein